MTVKKYLSDFDIKKSFEEIGEMSVMSFKKLVRHKSEETSLKYLLSQIKPKGKEIKYNNLKLQVYLNSYVTELNSNEKKRKN